MWAADEADLSQAARHDRGLVPSETKRQNYWWNHMAKMKQRENSKDNTPGALWLGSEQGFPEITPQLPTVGLGMRLFRIVVALLGVLLLADGVYNVLSAVSNPPWSIVNAVIGVATAIIGLFISIRYIILVGRSASSEAGVVNVADPIALTQLLFNLERMGFYKYTDSWVVNKLRTAALLDGDLFYPLNRRAFMANEDVIGPHEIDEFISMISPYLKMMRVSINSFSETFDEAGNYAIKVNGKSYIIHTADEVGKITEQDYAALVAKRTTTMLNRLFETARAEERVYLRKVNDYYQFIFITPKMYQLIWESAALKDEAKPQEVDEESQNKKRGNEQTD
jgi:hypothetical protein